MMLQSDLEAKQLTLAELVDEITTDAMRRKRKEQ